MWKKWQMEGEREGDIKKSGGKKVNPKKSI